MNELSELYQEVILDHTRAPRNFFEMGDATGSAAGHNPLCGDRVTVYLHLENGRVKNVSFQGSGCAISTASASLMTEAVKGKTLDEANRLFNAFHDMVTGQADPLLESGEPEFEKLAALAGVREFPMRVKCATLAWHTLKAALEDKSEPVSTE
ncbi:MAG: SUF system NifU family Fe-S cluster assembly protein [bacterium]|nr:SUF system NifU family Fe-S cluster assembly protein [bacterium]